MLITLRYYNIIIIFAVFVTQDFTTLYKITSICIIENYIALQQQKLMLPVKY